MRAIDVVKRLCPHARGDYLVAFEAGDAKLAAAGITNKARLAHFLAQVLHETDGLTIAEESGNYSAQRMMAVWPSRFETLADAAPYAHNPAKLFNKVYANRMGNGSPESGDGYRYRGRGVLQTTGREAYRNYGRRCGADFEGHPELILSAEFALAPALLEWAEGGCNAMADRDDIRGITRKINGGYTGLKSRVAWLQKVRVATAEIGGDFGAKVAPAAEPVEPAVATRPPKVPATGKLPSVTAAATAGATAAAAGSVSPLSVELVVAATVVVVAIVFLVTYLWERK